MRSDCQLRSHLLSLPPPSVSSVGAPDFDIPSSQTVNPELVINSTALYQSPFPPVEAPSSADHPQAEREPGSPTSLQPTNQNLNCDTPAYPANPLISSTTNPKSTHSFDQHASELRSDEKYPEHRSRTNSQSREKLSGIVRIKENCSHLHHQQKKKHPCFSGISSVGLEEQQSVSKTTIKHKTKRNRISQPHSLSSSPSTSPLPSLNPVFSSTTNHQSSSLLNLNHHSSHPEMGGCVAKGGASGTPAVLIDATVITNESERVSEGRTVSHLHAMVVPGQLQSADPVLGSGSEDTGCQMSRSPSSTRPTDSAASSGSTLSDEQQPSGCLKNLERRRLSLSQSDPAGPDVGGDVFRGQFLIRKAQNGTSSPEAPHSMTFGKLEQTNDSAAKNAKNQLESFEVDSEGSLPSSDDEDERLRREAEEQDVELKASLRAAPHVRECRRLSVSGILSSMKQDNFESKRQEVKSDTGYFDSNTLLSLGIGYVCKKGLKPESPNQDDFFIVRIDDWGLYGVFDGHGPFGHDVSNFVQRELPKIIYDDPKFFSCPETALRHSFIRVHEMLEQAAATHSLFDCSLSGSTATVVLHRKAINKLYIAHVGDSRCILGRLSKNGSKIEAVDLTIDHKPNSEKEKKRIIASGGQVRRLEGDIPYRVFLKGRLYPGLAMSRAIGDTVGAQAGVICRPDVTEYTIDVDRDLFIVLCSDGVWEFLSSSDVAEVVHSNGIHGVQASADTVARESWKRWIQEEGSVVDDITTEVIYLKPDSNA